MNNRVSLLIELDDSPGALYKLLAHFNDSQINLTNIESRPRQDGSFSFYLDFIGNTSNLQLRDKRPLPDQKTRSVINPPVRMPADQHHDRH